MHAETIPHQNAGLLLLKLIESLQEQIQAGHEREMMLLRLLEMDRQARHARSATDHPPAVDAAARRGPSALHTQILTALAAHPRGLTRAQVEAAVGTGPLGNVLDGLARRGHIRRLGKGLFAVCPETPAGQRKEHSDDEHRHSQECGTEAKGAALAPEIS